LKVFYPSFLHQTLSLALNKSLVKQFFAMKFMFDELSCLIQDLRFASAEQLWALEPDFQRSVVKGGYSAIFFSYLSSSALPFLARSYFVCATSLHFRLALPRSALGLCSFALV
jgi:hypothetical protein